jgi:hypothetical protein
MIGSLLTSPMTFLTFVVREIAHAVNEEREADRRAIMTELQELHRMIEQGAIGEVEFNTRETTLLDRLEGVSDESADIGKDGTQ